MKKKNRAVHKKKLKNLSKEILFQNLLKEFLN